MARSGSVPARVIWRGRMPCRLSTTTWNCAEVLSRTRSRLGSSFSATGVSTGAGEVIWTKVPVASISRGAVGGDRP